MTKFAFMKSIVYMKYFVFMNWLRRYEFTSFLRIIATYTYNYGSISSSKLFFCGGNFAFMDNYSFIENFISRKTLLLWKDLLCTITSVFIYENFVFMKKLVFMKTSFSWNTAFLHMYRIYGKLDLCRSSLEGRHLPFCTRGLRCSHGSRSAAYDPRVSRLWTVLPSGPINRRYEQTFVNGKLAEWLGHEGRCTHLDFEVLRVWDLTVAEENDEVLVDGTHIWRINIKVQCNLKTTKKSGQLNTHTRYYHFCRKKLREE